MEMYVYLAKAVIIAMYYSKNNEFDMCLGAGFCFIYSGNTTRVWTIFKGPG